MIGSEAITMMVTTGAQKGALFPIKAISCLLNGINMSEIEEKELKSQILFYIKRNNNIQISDISDYFKISGSEIIKILKELEQEGKIRRIN